MIYLLIAWPALVALALTLGNLWMWPRGRASDVDPGTISVLIPARNEAQNIEKCVRSVMEYAGAHILEIVVCDDQSTDETPDILARLAEEFPKLRVIQGVGLPEGWVGKVHACHRLSMEAQGDEFFFLDADVQLLPGGLQRILSLYRTDGLQDGRVADVVTAVPRQQMGTLVEKLIMPLLHLTYVSWLPMALVWRSADPRFLAANGQILFLHRQTLELLGGFEAIRSAIVDDMALCTLAKQKGFRVIFADGHHMATCRMYRSAKQVWEGFSKNIVAGLGGQLPALVFVTLLYLAAFVLPFVLLPAALVAGNTGLALGAGVAVVANVLQRIILGARHGHPWVGILLHPFAVLGLIAIAWNSWRWMRAKSVRWSGRVYSKVNG